MYSMILRTKTLYLVHLNSFFTFHMKTPLPLLHRLGFTYYLRLVRRTSQLTRRVVVR